MLTQEELDKAASQTLRDRALAETHRRDAVARKDLKTVTNLSQRIKCDEVILDCIYKMKLVISEDTTFSGLIKAQAEMKKKQEGKSGE